MTVEDLIQQAKNSQQQRQVRQSETLPEQAAEEELLAKIRSSREEASQDPFYTILHSRGKVKIRGVSIESF